MRPGNVTAGENHRHKRRADCDRSEWDFAADSHADGEDEEERTDEFNERFFHEELEWGRVGNARRLTGPRGEIKEISR
jgi:hypothetical protein